MNKYLPAILFAICIAIAVILAWTVQPLWPAALAIAIAGAALAMALRLQGGGGETAYLMDEISTLQETDAELRAELANARSMIDDLADVVEQLAAVTVDGGAGASREQMDSLRTEIAALESRLPTGEPDPMVLDRLGALETRLESLAAAPQPGATALASAAIAASAPAPTNGESGKLRSLIARATGRPDPAEDPAPDAAVGTSEPAVSLTPVFQPTLGAPVAFMVTAEPEDDVDAVPALFRHAAQIANELEGAQKDVRLFVRMSAMTLAHLTVRRDVLAVIDANPALQKRLTVITPQEGFDDTAQNTLAAFAERGCKFALDGVRDWSINLAALARAGLTYIVVDGVAMARSAQQQGGDPRRLAQALDVHGISLIGGGVFIRDDIDTVRALQPALVMGDGLGIPRVLEG